MAAVCTPTTTKIPAVHAYGAGWGRFLQTDPVGYADQLNLYAYVANDPVNRTDPTGQCAQLASTGQYVGVCPTTDDAIEVVDTILAQESSIWSTVEREAVAARQLVEVQTGQVDVEGREVKGGRTNLILHEDGSRDIVVTIDPTDRVVGNGTDVRTGRFVRGHIYSDGETLEHEGGHVRQYLTQDQDTEIQAIQAENDYRRARGNSFRRGKNDRVQARPRSFQNGCPASGSNSVTCGAGVDIWE